MDGAGTRLFEIEAERRRRVIPRPRSPGAAATVLLFTGVQVVRLPVPAAQASSGL